MRKFEIVHIDGTRVVVEADDEEAARTRAMTIKYGPPTGMYADGYHGLGLSVRELVK